VAQDLSSCRWNAPRVVATLVRPMRLVLVSVLSFAPLALAQSQPAPTPPRDGAKGAFGVDFTTQYFFRGLQQENQGIIAQPWIELGYALYEADGEHGLRDLGLTFGLWNSLHDGPTGGTGGIWYESDFHVGLDAHAGERWTFGATYTAYHSPNGSFSTVEEIAFAAGFDDRELLVAGLDSGLQPSVVVAFETDGERDGGTGNGIYAQLGIEPSFAIGNLGQLELTLALPVTLGTSLGDYYEDATGDDDFFGFLDVGAVVSSALPFLPARMGPWTAELGLHWLLLGDSNEQKNNGDTSELILSFGVATVF
jgi:hypothetical protein